MWVMRRDPSRRRAAWMITSTDEQIISRLREQFPDEGGAPISASMTLPPESVLEGTVEGRTVSFVKTYQGDAFSGFQIGSRRVGLSFSGHGVHYRGELSADGQTIEGQWWLEPDPDKGVTRRAEGTFLLRKGRDGSPP